MDDPLAVMRLLIERQHRPVGQNIVDEIDRHGGGESEIADLNRRRTIGQNPGPRLLGMTLQVDCDVDLEIAQKLRYVAVAAQHHVMKPIERFDQPGADVAAVVGTVGDAVHLKAAAVMQLEQLDDLPAGRMAVEGR